MRVVAAKEQLLNAVQIVQRAVSVRNPLPILSGIRFEAVENKIFLTATDLDMGIRCSFAAEVIEPGAAVLPAKYVSELVRRLPDVPVLLSAEPINGSVTIQYGQSETSINGYPAEEFPDFPIPSGDLTFDLPVEVLKGIVKQVVFAAANNENRPVFNGVLFELHDGSLQVIATDTYRLAWRRLPLENCEKIDINIIIPGKTLIELVKIIEPEKIVNITVTENQILFRADDTCLISRLIDGQFPNYKQVIPQTHLTKVRLKTKELAEATERASLLTKDGSPIVKMSLEQNTLIVSVNTEVGRVHEEIPVFQEGEPFEVAFNARYLGDVLKAMGSEEIIMELTGPLSPGVLRPVDDQEYLSLLLPVRLRGV
ncbi:MAG: DNA polymerase III subunit beta [Desulfotomaculaceae bacterium]|nr:DNA polymerase III subunit beta [Desulfotomaculaceae bacterium]